jgi:D-sedoheptulose 7-phosphate isomerase
MSTHNFAIENREVRNYFTALSKYLTETTATSATGQVLDLDEAVKRIIVNARRIHKVGNKLIFVGNGASAAIASHMATDYSKNGNIRSLALNDSSMLTCLGNDLGYDRVFSTQIELHARSGDLLFAISSSGAPRTFLTR